MLETDRIDIDRINRLVQQAQSGDNEAFEIIYLTYHTDIFRFSLKLNNGRWEDAEDLTSSAFTKAYERLATYQNRGLPFSAWLYRLTRNHFIDLQRSPRSTRNLSIDENFDGFDNTLQAAGGFEESVQISQDIKDAKIHLTSEQQLVITLRFLEGFDIKTTAEIMQKSEEAVKKLQFRGIARLRRHIS